MAKYDNILIVCVDRDNDLGRKTGIPGPVIGRKNNLNAAAKFGLADPGDADVNSMFAAIKKFDELKKQAKNIEIVTLTGVEKTGFESDKRINQQLDTVLEQFPADGVVFVSDGSEDEQVIPIIQSKVPVISIEMVIVKQAKEVEGTYYTIKEALKDPGIARIVFLVPGLIIILWGTLFFLGLEKLFFQSMSLILGLYLILKGTGLEEKIASIITSVTSAISLQKVSFPFYIATIVFFFIGIYASTLSFNQAASQGIARQVSGAGEQLINFFAIAGISFLCGRAIDSVQMKKAFFLRRYFLSIVAVSLLWFILDTTRKVLIGEPYAGIEFFLINFIISFGIAFLAYRASNTLDVTHKITKLLIGLPVYDKQGKWIGKVEAVEKQKKAIKYKNIKTKEVTELGKNSFIMREGKIFLS